MTELKRLLSQDDSCLISVASVKEALKQDSKKGKHMQYMNIGDRVKFRVMGNWYNSGIIKDIDEDSCLIEVNELGCKPPKDVCIQLPYYARVLLCEDIVKEDSK